jgi:hypothetical protein
VVWCGVARVLVASNDDDGLTDGTGTGHYSSLLRAWPAYGWNGLMECDAIVRWTGVLCGGWNGGSIGRFSSGGSTAVVTS